jgi:hypothetical protein
MPDKMPNCTMAIHAARATGMVVRSGHVGHSGWIGMSSTKYQPCGLQLYLKLTMSKQSTLKQTRSLLTFVFVLGFTAGVLSAQKPLSPPADTAVTINGMKISIHYSAPSMRGRKIFGDLEGYGRVWRTGANNATELVTAADLNINGLKVPKGKYSLFTFLDPTQWQLIVNKQTGMSGLDYDQGQDLGRVKMTMSKPGAPVETFKISLESAGGNKGKLTLAWENTVASVPFTVE